jgi:general secretion pathway protein D
VSPNPQLNLRSDATRGNLLANPRIRVRNREKARIHIGDKVPVITTTSTANVGVSENVSYLDVGLKLDVEPTISLDQEVAIKVGLEVSSIAREVTSRQGTLAYQVGTRTASTVLRVKDGETQVLAGLISDQDRTNANRVPGLGQLPVIGRLFANYHDERQKTEIALLITPRIVRGLPQRDALSLEYPAGTEAATGAAPLELQPRGAISTPLPGGAAPAGRPAPEAPANPAPAAPAAPAATPGQDAAPAAPPGR